jgi:hypothetical protein
MTEVRDNTLKILENNTLADIAFLSWTYKKIKGLSLHYQWKTLFDKKLITKP